MLAGMDILQSFSNMTLALIGFITLLTLYFHGPAYSSHTASNAPTILTSLGIFGTFFGVAIGLLDFNTDDIQQSVPSLIDGLKTAFWSSIVGLLGALSIKFRHTLHVVKTRHSDESFQAATIDDLANVLVEIRDALELDKANGLRAQVSNMHRDNNQRLDNLLESMDGYLDKMAEANARALITAIESVMHEFNVKINEQYGDNFKQLNTAVGQMLDWQQTYQEQLNMLIHQQKTSGEIMEQAATAYQTMVEKTEVFNVVSESLGTMLEGLQTQSKSLDGYLLGLSNLVINAADGLPALEGRVHSLTNHLAEGVKQNNDAVTHMLKEVTEEIRQTVQEVNVGLADSIKIAQSNLGDHVEKMVDRTEKQIMRLDDAMEDELTKALKTFGYQLTALSEKFVNDYTPLTDKLRNVVHLAAEKK